MERGDRALSRQGNGPWIDMVLVMLDDSFDRQLQTPSR